MQSPEEYKNDQRIRMNKYKIGCKDPYGNTITNVYCREDEYIIYEIKTEEPSNAIRFVIDTIIEDDDTLLKNYGAINDNFSKLKGVLYKVVNYTSIKPRIAQILARGISGCTDEANAQFICLINEIEDEYICQSKHRIKYLLTSVGILALGIILSIIAYSQSSFDQLIADYIYISTAASIGGFISIARKINKSNFQKGVSSYLYVLYAAERMLIAIVAGMVIYFAIQSNLIFGIVNNLENPIFGYLIFSVVAGFSETLVPNLLIKLEKNEK